MKKCKSFPLHIHWDGAVPAQDLFGIAQSKGVELLLPERDKNNRIIVYSSHQERIIRNVAQLDDLLDINTDKYSLFEAFNIPIGLMQTKRDIFLMARAHAKYLQSQGTAYAETRFAPQYHTKQGLSLDQAIGYAVEGFYAANRETGVDIRLIICIARESDPDYGVKVAKSAIRANKVFPDRVLALDLACYEPPYPPELFIKAFEETFDTPLKRTVHAGEMCDEKANLKNIRTAIFDLRADGLGHAIPLYKDEHLVSAVIERGIRIESCPISNSLFGFRLEDLYLDKLVETGVLVTINPDDPAMIRNCHLEDNMKLVRDAYGPEFARKVTSNSIKAAWGLSAEQKENYLKQL